MLVFVAPGFAALVLLILSSSLSDDPFGILFDPRGWLARLDGDRMFDITITSAQIVAGLLGIAITVVAIVLELAANRYSHRITGLFVREPVNFVVLGLFVVTTIQCLGVLTTRSEDGTIPTTSFVLTMTMVALSLLAVLPYFNFVLAFLSPLSMIERIRDGALGRMAGISESDAEGAQSAVEEAVDELQEVARSSTEQSDRRVAMASIEALAELIEGHDAVRDSLPAAWFAIAPSIATDPDFASLTPSALGEVERSGTWLEVKIMQQYLTLMNECVPQARDIANVIAITTYRIAVGPGRERPELRALCVRCMNSYLRTCINARDPRTAYYILNQYRLMAEEMLHWRHLDEAMKVAGYLEFYGNLGCSAGMPFLLETASYDLIQLIEADLDGDAALTDGLVDLLLGIDREARDEGNAESLVGVRCSQIQLATFFLERGELGRASRIVVELARESPTQLAKALVRLEKAVDPQYWEFTARGANFAYLPPELRARLGELAHMVERERSQARPKSED